MGTRHHDAGDLFLSHREDARAAEVDGDLGDEGFQNSRKSS